MKATLVWKRNPLVSRRKRIEETQAYIDESCIEGMNEFVPVAMPYYPGAGMLRDSAQIIEPGHIIYTAEHAEHQYYDELDHSDTGNPKATRLWFETMKKKYVHKILKGAQNVLTKGKSK